LRSLHGEGRFLADFATFSRGRRGGIQPERGGGLRGAGTDGVDVRAVGRVSAISIGYVPAAAGDVKLARSTDDGLVLDYKEELGADVSSRHV